ncbi:MAG: hypothetical protein E7Z87_02850 [Cyanobacteria bacterium SIG26]|nr:hypothetical protein [Cyanobacteria bacterium SIG26]
MSKNLGEVINNIMKENSSKRVLILTQNMQIIGTIHKYEGRCENCHDCIIALKDVKMAKFEDICHCNLTECECNLEVFMEFEWFNINTQAIIGFSILGNDSE